MRFSNTAEISFSDAAGSSAQARMEMLRSIRSVRSRTKYYFIIICTPARQPAKQE